MICFMFLCFLVLPPVPAVPDGAGGFVPFTNARVMPDGTLRPYDPAIDGVMAPDGRVYFLPVPYPPGRVTIGPPRVMPAPASRHAAKPPSKSSGGCYGPDGGWIGENNPECRTQSAPAPDHEHSL
jgi:hypothetical protein